MKDWNICENCNLYIDIGASHCPDCAQPMVLDARGKISVWRLGAIEDGLLGPVLRAIRETLGADVVLQPTYLDERPAARPSWKGLSTIVLLDQMERRHRRGIAASLAITEENISPGAAWNYVFGEGRMGGRVAIVSMKQAKDEDDPDLTTERVAKIATHELGHALGLDHHDYEDGIECIMVGDTELDDVDRLDESPLDFCAECMALVGKRLPVKGRRR